MHRLWKWISEIGVSQASERDQRSVVILNRINLFLILVSLLGFLATVIIYWLLPNGGPGLGALRLLLMIVAGIISFYLTYRRKYLFAKVFTSLIPECLLIIFPTILGDVKNEYYFYYPLGAIAFAIVPILVFQTKEQRPLLFILIGFSFLLALTNDILLSKFSFSGTMPAFIADRYFFFTRYHRSFYLPS